MKKNMNMTELFSEDELLEEYSLSYLARYNNRPRIKDESVATHSFFVSLHCVKLIEKIESLGYSLSCEERYKILSSAILHDVGETITSDVPYDVKQMNASVRDVLETIEQEYLSMKFGNSFCVQTADENDKDLNLVKAILKVADTLSVLQFCLNEMRLGNASEDVKGIYEDAKRRCERFSVAMFAELDERKV